MDTFMSSVAEKEEMISPMAKLQMILEKKGDERTFDELLIVRTQTNTIPCLKAVMSNLRPHQVDDLCRSMILERYETGSIVFRQGDVGDKFYVILSGSCDIRIKLPADAGGEEIVAVTYRDGQQFGERALDYNEPRAATVQATIDSALIAFPIQAYKNIIKNPEGVVEGGENKGSMKSRIAQVMSKNRINRGRDELATVVAHVCPRVQFLQKFTYEQQIELFRVCDFVTLWGKTTLFKQGTIGEAFYIVVSGHVNVLVTKKDSTGGLLELDVATIYAGSSFGEVALEKTDSRRTATCVTCEASTELLVIGKEDYKKLVVVVQQKDFSEKVSLLRRTHPFQALDISTLAELGKLMEYRSWRVNSIVYVAGEAANFFVVLNTGEFGIKSEVFMKDGSSKILDFGRVGPAAVLGENSFQCEMFGDEVLCRETVTANTNCTGYIVTKYDMFHRLPREHYTNIIETLKKLEIPKSNLWDTTPQVITEDDWKIQSVWSSYKKDVLKSFYNPLTNRAPNILAKVKHVEKKMYASPSQTPLDEDLEFDNQSASSVSSEDKAEELTSLSVGIVSPNARSRRGFRKKQRDAANASRSNSKPDIMQLHFEDAPDNFEPFSPDSSPKEKQVNFAGAQIGSMSFGLSPPGSPGSTRPSSRGEGTPDSNNLSRPGSRDMNNGQQNVTTYSVEPPKRTFFALPPNLGSMHQFALKSSTQLNGSAGGIGTVKNSVSTNIFRPPFCLIQLHREKLKMRPIQGSRRLLKCYFRVCGLVGSCNEAKLAAESQMLNISVRTTAGAGLSAYYLGQNTSLNWNRFTGFSTMPLQNTDHFLIYCRGSPIEYASFTPPVGVDLLDAPFPSACKPTGQHFACLSVYRIAAPRPSTVLYGEQDLHIELQRGDAEDPLAKPLLLKEMSCIVEAMGTAGSRLDILRYAFNLGEQAELQASVAGASADESKAKPARWSTKPDPKPTAVPTVTTVDGPNAPQRLIAVPLFVWLHISEDTFKFYDHADFTVEELSNEDKFINMMRNRLLPRQDMAIAVSELAAAHISYKGGSPSKVKSVTDELKDAIASVGQVLNDGVNKLHTANELRGFNMAKKSSPSLHRSASTEILNKEKATRVLMSTVDSRLQQLGKEDSLYSSDMVSVGSGVSGNSISTADSRSYVDLGKKKISNTSSIEFKIQALKDNIAIRQKVLSLSDELCRVETKLKLKQSSSNPRAARLPVEEKSVITYDPTGDVEMDEKTQMSPSDLVLAQKRLVEKRLEIFDALQSLPYNKFYSEAGEPPAKVSKFSKSGSVPPLHSSNSLRSVTSDTVLKKQQTRGASSMVRKKLSALDTISSTLTYSS